jgi:uncharacterized protein (DUF4415 family)
MSKVRGKSRAADDDNPPLDEATLARMRPAREAVLEVVAVAVNRGGRPRSQNPKQAIKLRLDRDLLAHFRATGRGWQTRINDTLRKAARLKRAGGGR